MRIYYDVTKARRSAHSSGLVRTGRELLKALKQIPDVEIFPVAWNGRNQRFVEEGSEHEPDARPDDVFVTPELFSEEERPGFGRFLSSADVIKVAIFYDAIPLKYPEFSWPKSVSRHPHYMKMLGAFDKIFAISEFSRAELLRYWSWLELSLPPEVDKLRLGADFNSTARVTTVIEPDEPPMILSIGILEPRKNQMLLLDVCERLWQEGERFELTLVGRGNPHFGKPILRRIKQMQRAGHALSHLTRGDDETLAALYGRARFSVFPSRCEGFGLPVLESLWAGVPCICSDIAPVRESADGGGCVQVCADDAQSLYAEVKQLLHSEEGRLRLRREATQRALPTWSESARQIVDALKSLHGMDARGEQAVG